MIEKKMKMALASVLLLCGVALSFAAEGGRWQMQGGPSHESNCATIIGCNGLCWYEYDWGCNMEVQDNDCQSTSTMQTRQDVVYCENNWIGWCSCP